MSRRQLYLPPPPPLRDPKEPVLKVVYSEVEEGTLDLTKEAFVAILKKAGFNIPEDAEVSTEAYYDDEYVVASVRNLSVMWKKTSKKENENG